MKRTAAGDSVWPDRQAIEISRPAKAGFERVQADPGILRLDAQQRQYGDTHARAHHRGHRAVVVGSEHIVGFDAHGPQSGLVELLAGVGVLADQRLPTHDGDRNGSGRELAGAGDEPERVVEEVPGVERVVDVAHHEAEIEVAVRKAIVEDRVVVALERDDVEVRQFLANRRR